METSPSKRPPFKIIYGLVFLTVFFLLVIGFFVRQLIQGQTLGTTFPQKINQQSAEGQNARRVFPRRLLIPGLGVDANVEYVGINPQGEMEVPSNTSDVGWYKLGPSPGETGSAVISGHVDGKEGGKGVFKDLDKLKPGDKVYVIDGAGETSTFMVREKRIYNPGYADEVFFSNGVHLNLVTCDGTWDEAKKIYTKRLVVFADKL